MVFQPPGVTGVATDRDTPLLLVLYPVPSLPRTRPCFWPMCLSPKTCLQGQGGLYPSLFPALNQHFKVSHDGDSPRGGTGTCGSQGQRGTDNTGQHSPQAVTWCSEKLKMSPDHPKVEMSVLESTECSGERNKVQVSPSGPAHRQQFPLGEDTGQMVRVGLTSGEVCMLSGKLRPGSTH